MRRKDREITDILAIEDIISRCDCCRLGFYDGEEVYIVPMNFGICKENDVYTLYFHSAFEGRKIDLISKVNSVCFEMDTNYKLNATDDAWECSARFQSIIGNGKISFVEEMSEKRKGLLALMQQHTKKSDWDMPDKIIDTVCVFKVVVDKLSCKQHD